MLEKAYSQIVATLDMVESVVKAIPDDKWKDGFSQLQVPWRQAYHMIECLEAYFSPGVKVRSGARFPGGYWQPNDEDAPTKQQILEYLAEVSKKIALQFEKDKARPLDEAYDSTRENSLSVIEQYIYALRHTMHHHGSLCTLAKLHGVADLEWR